MQAASGHAPPLVNRTLANIAPRLAAPLLKLLFASLRKEVLLPAQGLPETSRGVVFAFWHGQMIAGWLLARKLFPGIHHSAVVSLSPDGQLLSDTLVRFGFRLIRGSSSTGREEVRAGIASALGSGGLVAVTPDGPRGPLHRIKYGTIRLAAVQNAPLIFAEIHYERSRMLGSWDRFKLPVPFSRITVTLHLVELPDFSSEEELRRFADNLSDRFTHA